ncbi:MAG TPA: tetratricopeptide repeat protein [Terriglobia bacterium]|nr:tetratricopeptide repeat protein [Terriglobia bacterium]
MIPLGERKCPACGEDEGFLWSASRNELLLLSVLVLIILFSITTFSVKAYRGKERELAQKWYVSGERELNAGHAEAALGDFRSALVHSRNDPLIELQLARALSAAGHLHEARAYLLGLWESEPGNGTVNLELARLAAGSGSVAEAVQYYHDAIYGQWDASPTDHRRRARLELAEFLLKVGQKAQAQAELIALTADLPPDPALETQVATLLMKTGEYEHAAPLFRQALRLRPNYTAALEGAGEASFEMRNYPDARRYLARAKRLGSLSPQSQSLLEIATLIQESNPLAPRLSGHERASRALRAFAQSMQRLSECAEARGVSLDNNQQQYDLQKVHALASALQPKVRERILAHDPDLLLKATDMAFEIEKVTERACGEPKGADMALLLLSQVQEGGNE